MSILYEILYLIFVFVLYEKLIFKYFKYFYLAPMQKPFFREIRIISIIFSFISNERMITLGINP